MSENVLKVENATMQFGGVVAVDNLNLEVNEGEIVSLIGPNGAGKTTAFNVITGVYAPSNGRVYFNGECIVENYPHGKMKKLYKGEHAGEYTRSIEPTPDKITQMGMARTFQNIRLFSEMTVLENVMIGRHCRTKAGIFGAIVRDGRTRREEQDCIDRSYELLELVKLQDFWNETANNLPYGAQRRLEIARAMATEPRMLRLDEPAAGMNPQETNELKELVCSIRDNQQLSILLIEHDMGMVMEAASAAASAQAQVQAKAQPPAKTDSAATPSGRAAVAASGNPAPAVTASGATAPGPTTSGASGVDRVKYRRDAARQIRDAILIPADTEPGEYQTRLRLTISPQGEITDFKVISPTGDKLLDKYVQRGIRRAGSLPPPPAELGGTLDITLTLVRR